MTYAVRKRRLCTATIAAIAMASPAVAQTYRFAVAAKAFAHTPASVTATGGMVVALSSSQDGAEGFTIGRNNGLFRTLGADLLIDSGTGGDTLMLTFSRPVTSVSFGYALIDLLGRNGDDTLTVSDGVVRRTFGATTPHGDLFPQGNAAFIDKAGFARLTITAAEAFSIGLAPE